MKETEGNEFSRFNIDNGDGLLDFLEYSGLRIENASGLGGPGNVIKLPDLTTFNWKSKDGVVRVNCKDKAMNVIEQKTDLKHIDNGPGDPTRPYSFIIDNLSDLIDVIFSLKTIEGNK